MRGKWSNAGKGEVRLSSSSTPVGQSFSTKVLTPLNFQVALGEQHITVDQFAFSIICVNGITVCVPLGLFFAFSIITPRPKCCSRYQQCWQTHPGVASMGRTIFDPLPLVWVGPVTASNKPNPAKATEGPAPLYFTFAPLLNLELYLTQNLF